ncbi:MAG: hypothetical protein ABIR66_13860, partial [Saprospiraceae bacterium]
MKKAIFIIFMILIKTWTMYAQALEHSQGEILIQVKGSDDLKKIVSGISSLRRAGSFQSATALSAEQVWYKLKFDFTQYNENEVLEQVRSHRKTVTAQFNHLVAMRRNPNDPQFTAQWQWLNDGINGK